MLSINNSTSKNNVIYFSGKKNTAEKIVRDLKADVFSKKSIDEFGYKHMKKQESLLNKFITEILVPRLEKSELTCKELAEQFKELFHLDDLA